MKIIFATRIENTKCLYNIVIGVNSARSLRAILSFPFYNLDVRMPYSMEW